MRFSRCPLWLLTACFGAVLGLGGQPVLGQDSLTPTILQASAPLTSQEKATVDAFVDAQVQKLQSQDPQQVAEGRARLVEQFSLSTSSDFLEYYGQAITNRVVPLLVPDQALMTRLNVAIISAKLTGDNLILVLEAGADDPSPAVRYWIAKAVGGAIREGHLKDKQAQRKALDVLAKRLKLEEASLVLEQVMLAMAEIELPEALRKVLEGLNSRVTFHKQNPTAHFKPVRGGMEQLWSKLIELRSDSKNRVDKEQFELARIAFRYYALIADQLDEEDPNNDDEEDEEVREDKSWMASICGRVMDDVAKEVAKLTPPQLADTKIAAELRVSADRWREMLKEPPFNFTDDQLSVEQADAD